MFRVSYPRAQWSEGRKGALFPFYFPFPFLPLLLFVTMASRVLANNDDNDINYRETKGCVEFTRNLATRGLTIKLRLIKLFLNLELLNINC